MNRLVKDALLRCKRASFTLQKGIFCNAKGALLQCKRASFAMQKVPFYNAKEHVLLSYMVFFIT